MDILSLSLPLIWKRLGKLHPLEEEWRIWFEIIVSHSQYSSGWAFSQATRSPLGYLESVNKLKKIDGPSVNTSTTNLRKLLHMGPRRSMGSFSWVSNSKSRSWTVIYHLHSLLSSNSEDFDFTFTGDSRTSFSFSIFWSLLFSLGIITATFKLFIIIFIIIIIHHHNHEIIRFQNGHRLDLISSLDIEY